jgi:ankyrin repeat protein
MSITTFLSHYWNFQIIRLAGMLLITLVWSISAFSDSPTGAALNAMSVPTFSDPIHVAAKAGDLSKVGALLKDNPGLVSSRDEGWAPLHVAAEFGKKDIAALLLAKGSEVNVKDKDGNTPLHFALQRGQKDVVELLRQHGGHE